jgi:hypothetical protein
VPPRRRILEPTRLRGPRLLAAALLAVVPALAAQGQFFPDGEDVLNYDPESGPTGRIYVGDGSGKSPCHYRYDLPAGKSVSDVEIGSDDDDPVVRYSNGEDEIVTVRIEDFEKVTADGEPCPEGDAARLAREAVFAQAGPIPVSNDADSFDVTSDGRFAVVAGANSATPVALVDLEAGAEVDAFAFDGIASFVAACDDGESVLVVLDGTQVRRLTIGVGGTLDDTGESFAVEGATTAILKVFAVPGSRLGLALVLQFSGGSGARLESFAVPGLQALDATALGGSSDLSAAVAPAGDRVYVRSNDDIEGFTLEPLTGALGDAPFLPISGVSQPFIPPNYGNALGITRDGTRLVASEPAYTPTPEVPTPRVTFFDATTGERVGILEGPDFVRPRLVDVRTVPEPVASTLAWAALAALAARALVQRASGTGGRFRPPGPAGRNSTSQ